MNQLAIDWMFQKVTCKVVCICWCFAWLTKTRVTYITMARAQWLKQTSEWQYLIKYFFSHKFQESIHSLNHKFDSAQTFRIVQAQQMIKVGDKKFTSPKQKSYFRQKREGNPPPPPNQQKTQPTWIWLKFSE